MNSPQNLKYTKTHEWIRAQDRQIEVGLTDFAQHQLSDITYVELPDVGRQADAGDDVCVVESIKAASDVYAPVSGTITEVNSALAQTPDVINSDPYGAGWLFKMTADNPADLAKLMNAKAYEASLPKDH